MWYIYDYSFIVTNGYRLEPAKKKKKKHRDWSLGGSKYKDPMSLGMHFWHRYMS